MTASKNKPTNAKPAQVVREKALTGKAKPVGAGKKETVDVGLQLSSKGGKNELDDLTRQLRDELLGLDVDDVQLVSKGAPPPEAKGLGLLAVGGLIVKLVGSKAFANVVAAVAAWLARDKSRTAKLKIGNETIELSGLSAKQQQALIDTWTKKVPPTKKTK